jgi:hypothetical protein
MIRVLVFEADGRVQKKEERRKEDCSGTGRKRIHREERRLNGGIKSSL